MEAVERRLRRAVCTPTKGGRPTHSWGERAAMFTFQVDTEAMGILGMLQQEPGTGEGLLACGAYITGRLIPATCNTQRKKCLNIFTIKLKKLLFVYSTLLDLQSEMNRHI